MKITGIVREGNKRGREIGFPTANITNTAQIPLGIFAANVEYDGKRYMGAAYVGAPQPDVLEVHILDLSENLYGKKIEVEIIEKIRDDINEPDGAKLKAMIDADIVKIKILLYSHNAKQK